jgi:hypothetical protein
VLNNRTKYNSFHLKVAGKTVGHFIKEVSEEFFESEGDRRTIKSTISVFIVFCHNLSLPDCFQNPWGFSPARV